MKVFGMGLLGFMHISVEHFPSARELNYHNEENRLKTLRTYDPNDSL